MTGTRWAMVGLVVALGLATVWRWHTIGTVEGEPLDCDESAYAYIGRRMLRGDVLYRDLTENKPPVGYWLYGLAVGVGGATERTVRLMALPYALGAIGLVWWIGLRLAGPVAAVAAALVFALADADPYVFGNGSNLEHFLNLFALAGLALMIGRRSRRALVGAGVCVALATLVKQVGATHGIVFAAALMLDRTRGWRERIGDLGALAVGFVAPCLICLGVIVAGGAGRSAYEDVIVFARALTTDIPPPANAPPALMRWVTGNADPAGRLPWPFGTTDYYAWWGAGLWPIWLAGIVATVGLGVRGRVGRRGESRHATPPNPPLARGGGGKEERGEEEANSDPEAAGAIGTRGVRSGLTPSPPLPRGGTGGSPSGLRSRPDLTFGRRLLAAWTASCWVQILLPGLFWQHYYLLAVPGTTLAVAIALDDAIRGVRPRPLRSILAALTLLAAIGWSVRIQVRDYWDLSPAEITSKFKGGRQWVALRALGRELAARKAAWDDPRLFVWGWQSPLFVYSGIDGVTRHFFANELLKAHADDDHPLIRPWIDEIVRDLEARRPGLIFAGDVPFPRLRRFLNEHYLPSRLGQVAPDGRGLWVDREHYDAFHAPRP